MEPALVATESKTVTLAGGKLTKDPKINWMMFLYRNCLDKARLGGQNKLKQKCLEKRFFFCFLSRMYLVAYLVDMERSTYREHLLTKLRFTTH